RNKFPETAKIFSKILGGALGAFRAGKSLVTPGFRFRTSVESGEIDGIEVSGYGNVPLQLFLDGALQRLRRGRLAVDEVGLLGRSGKAGEPAEQFAFAGVR